MSNILDEFKDPQKSKALIAKIKEIANDIILHTERTINIMEVCGTHTVSLARYGIQNILPKKIKLLSGPGCPVCVTSNKEIDTAIELAKLPNVIITTYGDMMRVPGTKSSLSKEKTLGADVRVCYSQIDALNIAKENTDKNVIFIAVGFETTTPLTAATLKRAKAENISNFYILNAHKSVPNTLNLLVNDKDIQLNALILPGHVSTIIGIKPYQFLSEKYNIGGVVTGFEPIDILLAIKTLLIQIRNNKPAIVNNYERAVRNEGNTVACATIDEVFTTCNSNWRGLGIISNSGYKLKEDYMQFDATNKFEVDISYSSENSACKCGEVLRGKITPKQCPLFDKACNPQNPIGPCMVSSEGSCAAYFKYLR